MQGMDGLVRRADEDVATSHAAVPDESVADGDEALDRLTKMVFTVEHNLKHYLEPEGLDETVARRRNPVHSGDEWAEDHLRPPASVATIAVPGVKPDVV